MERSLAEGSSQRGADGGQGDCDQHRCPQRKREPGDRYPDGPLIEHQVTILAEGLCDHEGCKERGREEGNDSYRARRQFSASNQQWTCAAFMTTLVRVTMTITIQSVVMKHFLDRGALPRKRR